MLVGVYAGSCLTRQGWASDRGLEMKRRIKTFGTLATKDTKGRNWIRRPTVSAAGYSAMEALRLLTWSAVMPIVAM